MRTSSSTPYCFFIFSQKGSNFSSISRPAMMARCGSSSWAIGAPKKAKIASPIKRAKVPSYLYTGEIKYSKALFMMSVHSSGSNCSAAAVDPTISQKSIVTILRSPSIARFLLAASSLEANSAGIKRSKPNC